MPARPFVQYRCQRPVLRLDLLYRGCNLHTALEHISKYLSSYFCATPNCNNHDTDMYIKMSIDLGNNLALFVDFFHVTSIEKHQVLASPDHTKG